MKRIAVAAVALFGSMLVLGACGAGGNAGATQGKQAESRSEVWTLSDQPADVIAAYTFVAGHRQEAQQIPCYCGCVGLNHGSLGDCFLKREGSYEEHASGCGVCRDEAADLKRFLDGGQDARAARVYIDEQYGGLGKPTNTP